MLFCFRYLVGFVGVFVGRRFVWYMGPLLDAPRPCFFLPFIWASLWSLLPPLEDCTGFAATPLWHQGLRGATWLRPGLPVRGCSFPWALSEPSFFVAYVMEQMFGLSHQGCSPETARRREVLVLLVTRNLGAIAGTINQVPTSEGGGAPQYNSHPSASSTPCKG